MHGIHIKKYILGILFIASTMTCLPVLAQPFPTSEQDLTLMLYDVNVDNQWRAAVIIFSHRKNYSNQARHDAIEVSLKLIDELQTSGTELETKLRPFDVIRYLVEWASDEVAVIQETKKYLSGRRRSEDLAELFRVLSQVKKLPKNAYVVSEFLESILPYVIFSLSPADHTRIHAIQALFSLMTLIDVQKFPALKALLDATSVYLDDPNPWISVAAAGIALRAGTQIEKAWLIIAKVFQVYPAREDGVQYLAASAVKHASLRAKIKMPPRVFLEAKKVWIQSLCTQALGKIGTAVFNSN